MDRAREIINNSPGDFIATGTLGVIGTSMAVYSEAMQRNLSLYWKLAEQISVPFANVVMGKFGDIGVGLAGAALESALLGVFCQGEKKLMLVGGLTGGIWMSLYYSAIEFNQMKYSEPLASCANPGEFCNGELTDVLAFSVPLIAAGIMGIRSLKNKRSLSKED